MFRFGVTQNLYSSYKNLSRKRKALSKGRLPTNKEAREARVKAYLESQTLPPQNET